MWPDISSKDRSFTSTCWPCSELEESTASTRRPCGARMAQIQSSLELRACASRTSGEKVEFQEAYVDGCAYGPCGGKIKKPCRRLRSITKQIWKMQKLYDFRGRSLRRWRHCSQDSSQSLDNVRANCEGDPGCTCGA